MWADLANDGLGGYAEYAAVQCSHLGTAPPSLSLLEAGTLPLVAMTGRAALFAAGAPWRDPVSYTHLTLPTICSV